MVKRSRFMSTKLKKKISSFKKMPSILSAIDEGMSRKELGRILSKTDPSFAKSIEARYYYEAKKCQVCEMADNEEKLILCDRCDDAYHLYCLNPPLGQVPQKEWVCKACAKQLQHEQREETPKPAKDEKCAKCNQKIWASFKIIKRAKISKQRSEASGDQKEVSKGQSAYSVNLQPESTFCSVKTKQKSKNIIVNWSNKGILCKCCKVWFHKDNCLNIRYNAVNCESCQRNIRVNGPKSHQEFLKYIENCYEDALSKHEVLGIDDNVPLDQNQEVFRAKFIGLRLPPCITDWLQIVQQEMTLHYALKTEGMKFIDGQVYNPNELPLAANDAEVQKIISPLSIKDQLTFIQFKRQSRWGFCAPIQIMEDRKVGFYARALMFIPSYTILYQYAGQVICSRQSLNQNNDSIMGLLRTPRSSTSFDICPSKYGNGSKFISGINNKDRTWRYIQNVKTLRFIFNGRIRLLFFAKRDIKAGETLYINYNAGAFQEYPTEHFVH